MKVKDWLRNTGSSWYNKYLEKYMDVKIVKQVSSVGDDDHWDKYLKLVHKYFPKHQNVYSFIVLENGWCVGWNENPSHGWSFPKSVKKWNNENI